MEQFLIITNKEKDEDFIITKRIAAYIKRAGKQATISYVSSFEKNSFTDVTTIPKGIECAIVLGGDGTIIHAANDLMVYNIPILGVNLGTLGFLAEIEEQHVNDALDCLFKDEFRLETRMMIQGNVLNGTRDSAENDSMATGYALNDIVVTRKGFSRIISIRIYVNDELVDDYRGDGVIISTPTGSTGYNLSAGGPVVIPKASALVITPICPHSLNARSIVVSAEDIIKVIVGKSKKTQEAEAIATFDGGKVVDLETEDAIIINRAKYDTKLIKLNHTNIFEILRSKLGRNED